MEKLADSLLACGLAEHLGVKHPVIHVPTLNHLYNQQRDPATHCLNAKAIRDFSLALGEAVANTLHHRRFALVLGGDCSLLLGILSGLKRKGIYGLIFLDAHADFYAPEQSTTGEVADMELAMVTGRGPALLTNINHQRPYVNEEQVIHVGQRDGEEARQYGSAAIQDTAIQCFDLAVIEKKGMDVVIQEVIETVQSSAVDGYWVHFDTDVLSDSLNPAVDYRLPGGLSFQQVESLIQYLLRTDRVAGMSVTIFNPSLDNDGSIARSIKESLGRAFDLNNR